MRRKETILILKVNCSKNIGLGISKIFFFFSFSFWHNLGLKMATFSGGNRKGRRIKFQAAVHNQNKHFSLTPNCSGWGKEVLENFFFFFLNISPTTTIYKTGNFNLKCVVPCLLLYRLSFKTKGKEKNDER